METLKLTEVFASLYARTPDAVVLYDRQGVIVAANEAAQSLSGYSESEMVGLHVEVGAAPRDIERVRLGIQTALAGATDHFDSTIRHRDGTIVPVEIYAYPARQGEEIVGFFVQARDIVALRSAEESLGANQERFRSLFEYHPDGIIELREDGSVSRVNVSFESETGFYTEQLVGKEWTEFLAPERRAEAKDALQSAIRGEAVEHDSLLLDRLGNRIDVQLKLVPLHARAQILGAYAVFKNITAQKTAERRIATQSEQIRRLYLVAATLTESIDEQIDATLLLGLELFGFDQGYVSLIDDNKVTMRNSVGFGERIAKGTVYPLELAFARHLTPEYPQLAIGDTESEEWRNDSARIGSPWRSYFAVRMRVGLDVVGAIVFASRVPRHDAIEQHERDLIQLMGLFIAAAIERAIANERIEQMAFTDALTGLPNRVLFSDRIEHTLATAKRYNRGFAVMYLDLDKFKNINDGYGHAIGDKVLQEVAQRLRMTLRESDTVARFGGDEFVILQPIVDGASDAADLARKINLAMQSPVIVDGVAHQVYISIGIAIYPGDAVTIDTLTESADRALYRAKREGRNRWCFANQESARKELRRATTR